MGSGKSTVARRLGERAGVAVVDLDRVIEERTGRTVIQLFAERGEGAFRDLERNVLRELMSVHPSGVFALGGGAVTDLRSRRELLRAGTVITLTAAPAELARRVGEGSARPLLAGQDVLARIEELLELRADAYAECHAWIDTTGVQPDDVAERALAAQRRALIVVPLGRRTYRVEIGRGILERLLQHARSLAAGERWVVVSDQTVAPLWAEALADELAASGAGVTRVWLEPGEEHKTIESVRRIWDSALRAGVDRSCGVIAIGGGVVGDLAAFAASTLLRGLPIGHVPTTLLAMADSAIGGKTGFDTAQGKNLVGTFHQPSFVLCDVDTLTTLPAAERTAGLAEVVKSAWIDSEQAVRQLEQDAQALAAGEVAATLRALRMACALKARIVSDDEREAGLRALLNFGHTLGHAIEAARGYRGIRHGEAVALGMVVASRVAERLGLAETASSQRLARLLDVLGLPTTVDGYLCEEVLGFVGADKKRRSESVQYVVPRAPGRVELRAIPLRELPGLVLA
jgi:3-dehydroquinate synthase